MSGLCKDCKWWGVLPVHVEKEVIPNHGQRVCGCWAIRFDSPDGLTIPSDHANVVDGSNYFAALYTGSDFGCVQWEAGE